MPSIWVLTTLIAGLLVLVSFAQPAADRLHLPYTVLLSIIGVALAALASFLLYTPLTDVFNEIAEPLVKFPFNATVFLVVFLPLLLFDAALTIDVRELVEDAAHPPKRKGAARARRFLWRDGALRRRSAHSGCDSDRVLPAYSSQLSGFLTLPRQPPCGQSTNRSCCGGAHNYERKEASGTNFGCDMTIQATYWRSGLLTKEEVQVMQYGSTKP